MLGAKFGMTDWQAHKKHNLIATRRRKKAPNAHGAKLTFVAEGREAEFTLMLRKGFLDDLRCRRCRRGHGGAGDGWHDGFERYRMV